MGIHVQVQCTKLKLTCANIDRTPWKLVNNIRLNMGNIRFWKIHKSLVYLVNKLKWTYKMEKAYSIFQRLCFCRNDMHIVLIWFVSRFCFCLFCFVFWCVFFIFWCRFRQRLLETKFHIHIKHFAYYNIRRTHHRGPTGPKILFATLARHERPMFYVLCHTISPHNT